MALAQRAPRTRRLGLRTVVGLVVLAVVVVAMVLSTKFLTPAELTQIAPKKFDPAATAADLYGKAQSTLPGSAADLAKVVPAMQADPKGAAATYHAVSPNENAYVFPVKTTATVTEASAATLRLQVDGVGQTPILVPLSTAVNGTVLRDAMGFKFADAPGQTDYQYVGDELKKLILADLQTQVSDPAALKGKKVDVVGVINVIAAGTSVPKAKPVNIQPLSVKAAG